MANNFPIREVQSRIKAAIPGALRVMGKEAIGFILDNFQKQGYQGATFQRWPDRKNKKKSKGRNILIQAGTLRRGWRYTTNAGALTTTIQNSVPYAKIHNEGGVINHPARQSILHFKEFKNGKRKGKILFSKERFATHGRKVNVGAYNIQMPTRRMYGNSPVVQTKIYNALAHHFSTAISMQTKNLDLKK